MYLTRALAGRGYAVAYPEFSGDGTAVINGFYRSLADSAAKYFETLIIDGSRTVCRCFFSVSEGPRGIEVCVTLTLRECGRPLTRKELHHRWQRQGTDLLLCRDSSEGFFEKIFSGLRKGSGRHT